MRATSVATESVVACARATLGPVVTRHARRATIGTCAIFTIARTTLVRFVLVAHHAVWRALTSSAAIKTATFTIRTAGIVRFLARESGAKFVHRIADQPAAAISVL